MRQPTPPTPGGNCHPPKVTIIRNASTSPCETYGCTSDQSGRRTASTTRRSFFLKSSPTSMAAETQLARVAASAAPATPMLRAVGLGLEVEK
jgi:hypothetical protein